MPYIDIETLKKSRDYVNSEVKKPETFVGLILFLISAIGAQDGSLYIRSDMKKFSKYADDAFFLGQTEFSYPDKTWYGLLGPHSADEARDLFLGGEKIKAEYFFASLFWYREFNDVKGLLCWAKEKIGTEFYDALFESGNVGDVNYSKESPCDRLDLLKDLGGENNKATIKYDGTFIKARAGATSAAPYGQTLYAATEVKKVINTFDFDFLERFSLSHSKKSNLNYEESTGWKQLVCENKISLFAYKVIKYLVTHYREKIISQSTVNIKNNTKLDLPHLSNVIHFSENELSLDERSTGDPPTRRFADEPLKIDDTTLWYISTQWNGSIDKNLCYAKLKLYVEEYFTDYSIINNSTDFCLVKRARANFYKRLSKPFLLLAGISGTGKTRFVREQAGMTGSLAETYQLVSVRPDWHEPSDVLGYTTRLSGEAEYVTTDVLKFLVKAWQAIAPQAAGLDASGYRGSLASLSTIPPYWLCLDEMNLAPVEQYFADYLSVLETREWVWEGDESFRYRCDPLLSKSVIAGLKDGGRKKLRTDLGLDGDDGLWEYFSNHGVGIPFNLIVAGTVNMDETTHGFSRKVIDRALTIDFGEFFPNEFEEFFDQKTKPKALSYPIHSNALKAKECLPEVDDKGEKSIEFLQVVNGVLADSPFALAYRALNELLLSVVCNEPSDEKMLQAVWDDFLMCKVLPRVEGDVDKLGGNREDNLLTKLSKVLSEKLDKIWEGAERQDLLRGNTDGSELNITCKSKEKIEWMQTKLERGYTTFWQ